MKYLWILIVLSATSAFGQNSYGTDYLNLHCTAPDPNAPPNFGDQPRPGLVPSAAATGNMVIYCDAASGKMKTSVSGGAFLTTGGGVLPSFGSYTFSVSGATVSATNNATGNVDFSGTDTAVVFNSVTSALATTGGYLYFKNGVYPINSMTLETATACSNFQGSGNALAYALAFPSNTSYATAVQWFVTGESATVWTGELGLSTIAANGVVFNITATAVSSVAANSVLVGLWQRPIANCTLTTTSGNNSNDLRFANITVRFPTNQRGNEIAFGPYFAGTVGYNNTLADFNLSYNSIATGSAPVVGSYNSIGYTSTTSSEGNFQDFTQTYAVGYNIGYDWAEHITGNDITAIYNNFAAQFGRATYSTVFHNSTIHHFVDQENLNGIQFGASLVSGTRIDILDLDFELGTANWYARTTGAMTEANPGNTSGLITYKMITQLTGIVDGGTGQLFTSGGTNITAIGNPSNFYLLPVSDTFAHPNFTSLGPGWIRYTWAGAGNLQNQSNAATSVSAAASESSNAIQFYNSDQFSKATVNTIDSSSSTFAEVMTNANTSPSVRTYYTYFCSHVAAGGSGIIKVVTGTSTTLASQSAAVGCNAGDTIELRHIGTFLYAYRNGSIDTSFSPNPVSDSSITGGNPGIFLAQDVQGGVTLTNWIGGSMPTLHGTDSLYNNTVYATGYATVGNCAVNSVSPAACGAAPAGAVVIPTTTTTYVINTTAVTATSRIFLQPMTWASNLPSAPTCVAPAAGFLGVSASTAGTSFTVTLPSTTGTVCLNYWIVN